MDLNQIFMDMSKIAYPSIKKEDGNLLCGKHQCSSYQLTYGEIEIDGMKKIANYVKKHHNKNPREMCFVDLGSGNGKFVLYMALFEHILSYGIEMVEHRYDNAIVAREILLKYGFPCAKYINFIHGNIFDKKYTKILNKSTIIFVSNLCFSEISQSNLYNLLNNELPTNALVFCSKMLTDDKNSNLVYETTISIPMTWFKESTIHVYHVKNGNK